MNQPPFRSFFTVLGRRLPCFPAGLSKLTRKKEEREGAFHTRDALSGSIRFRQDDFATLYAVERSSDRCTTVVFELEQLVAGNYLPLHKAGFTLNACKFNVDKCEIEVSPVAQDGYDLLYNNWEKKVNILACPAPRTTITTTIDQLPAGDALEFRRIGEGELIDYSGNGWSVFLKNTAWVAGSGLQGGTRMKDLLVFRLAKRGVPYELDSELNEYVPADLSGSGYQLDEEWVAPDTSSATTTADYVKTVGISGFSPYIIGRYSDWTRKYGRELVLTECGAPSPGVGYIKITGPDPTGANNAENGGTCLNLRRKVNQDNFKAVWWRYGAFRFSRCFPFLAGLHYLLSQTVPSICPPDPAQLSYFFTQDENQATKETGRLNELPRLYLAAGSDIKRPNSSEPATRLRVTLKDVLTDTANSWDCGWFIDPTTGFLRLEHRAYLEDNKLQPVDLTDSSLHPKSTLSYSYLQQQMPRVERLTVQNAATEATGVNFLEASVTYSGNCVTQEEGQNESSRNVGLLTGDIRGLVLSGDTLPDACLAVLIAAPLSLGQLTAEVENGNRALAASNLFKRYHRRGRVLSEGVLAEGGFVTFDSTRSVVQLDPVTLDACTGLDFFGLDREYTTRYSSGGDFQQAEWDLGSTRVTVTIQHGALTGLPRATPPHEYDPTQFDPAQFA